MVFFVHFVNFDITFLNRRNRSSPKKIILMCYNQLCICWLLTRYHFSKPKTLFYYAKKFFFGLQQFAEGYIHMYL